MADLVDKVGESYDSKYLNKSNNYDLSIVLGTDISIAYGKDSCAAKVKAINILDYRTFILDTSSLDPSLIEAELRRLEQYY